MGLASQWATIKRERKGEGREKGIEEGRGEKKRERRRESRVLEGGKRGLSIG